MNKEYNFNAKTVKDRMVEDIRKWFETEGGCPNGPAVIGISGGKDSSVVAALCAEALGPDRVIGVLMPNGEQSDIDDSYRVVEALGIKHVTVNIEDAYEAIAMSVVNFYKRSEEEDNTNINQFLVNLAPRVRMCVLYAVAQRNGGRVMNTCNLSETMVGWETRWGDSVGDYSPLGRLTKTEVVAVGRYCEKLPLDLVEKVPSDGLCGKTDEDGLGFTYDALDKYLRYGGCDDLETLEKIQRKIMASSFKRRPIPAFELVVD